MPYMFYLSKMGILYIKYIIENCLYYIRGIRKLKEKLLEMYDIIKELRDLSYIETASYIVQTLIDKIKYIDYIKENYDDAEARIENIDEFKNSILELENVVGELRLNEYLENVSLISATDDLEEKSDYVKLMTIHNSKGLEFPIVFLVGFENEIFPGTRAMFEEKEMEEERRLCYVALTRAEKKLYLSHATIRFVYGQDRLSTPSVFLKEIPEKLLDIDVKKERLYFADDYSDEIKAYDNSRKFEKKKTEIEKVLTIPTTTILYESPYRIEETLKYINNIDPNRTLCVAREISKLHEEYINGNANTILDKLNPKGEFVIIISKPQNISIDFNKLSLEEHYNYYLSQGLNKKEIIKKISTDLKVHKSEIYKLLIDF